MKRAKHVRLAFDKKPVLAQDPPKLEAANEKIRGAGICMLAKDTGRVLFLKRSPTSSHPGTYDLPGGTTEPGETPAQTARRETREEIGVDLRAELAPMSDTTMDGVNYTTLYHECRTEFSPKLDESEHTEHVWAFPNDPPQPLHPGVALTLNDELAKDANPLSVAAIRLGHKGGKSTSPATVAASRQNGAQHGHDAALAFDKATNRSYDIDGRLKVEQSNISRAMVCEYLGSEIPDPTGLLGLIPDKLYKLFRDPDELAKAVDTFNNIQLLSEHVPVSTTDIQKDLIIGCTGTDTVFEFPFLKNSLCVWTAEGIGRVENKEAQEISCSYRYDADMTPGEFEGVRFDGSMRNIHGNHVILTPAGRCGPTVIVGDSALPKDLPQQATPPSRTTINLQLENKTMPQTLSKKALRVRGVLHAVLKPQFAADKMPDLDKILVGVTAKNYVAKKPLITAAIKSHMAADAGVGALVELLDSLEADGIEDEADLSLNADPIEAILAHCRGKLSDDELGELEGKVRALAPAAKANDEPPEFKGEPKPGDKPAADEEKDKKEEKDMVSKTAMDAAIAASTKAAEDRAITRINGIHEARKIAAPFVGEIAVACDSAEDVYRAALKIRGVNTEGVHPSAFRTILECQPSATAKPDAVHAHDAAHVSGMDKFLTDLGLAA